MCPKHTCDSGAWMFITSYHEQVTQLNNVSDHSVQHAPELVASWVYVMHVFSTCYVVSTIKHPFLLTTLFSVISNPLISEDIRVSTLWGNTVKQCCAI
jgi:hypothetical protein